MATDFSEALNIIVFFYTQIWHSQPDSRNERTDKFNGDLALNSGIS
jgi:hypothetical protein